MTGPIPNLQVVHESETQRQHVRLQIPARAQIDGGEYALKDLSSGGVGVRDVPGPFMMGQRLPVDIRLPLGSFALNVRMEAEVRHYNAKTRALGCIFVNQTPEQLSVINHAIKSFIAGDLVSPRDMLGVAMRDNYTRPRKPANANTTKISLLRQLPGLLMVAAAGFSLAAFIALRLYNSVFIVHASSAAVTAPAAELRAPVTGLYRSRIEQGRTTVTSGETIGTVSPAGGAPVAIKSPCDCTLGKAYAVDGQYLTAGDQVAALVSTDAHPWVTAEVGPSEAAKIRMDMPARVSVFGTDGAYEGRVARVETSASRNLAERSVVLTILMDQKLPADLINRPAAVAFKIH
jgi:alginate biosynthesis protein Alg44